MDAEKFGERYAVNDIEIKNPRNLDVSSTPFDKHAGRLTLQALGISIYLPDQIPEDIFIEEHMHREMHSHRELNNYFLNGNGDPTRRIKNPTFQLLSDAFLPFWHYISEEIRLDGTIDEPIDVADRYETLTRAHAIGALLLYKRRQIILNDFNRSVDNYLITRESPQKSYIEGALSEFDAAIILLDIAKNEDFIVLPAPPIFESAKKTSRYNIDFVVISPQHKSAAGVQVKSMVHGDASDKYACDEDGFMLLDGMADLGNTRRISHKSIKLANANSVFGGSVIQACLRYYGRDINCNPYISDDRKRSRGYDLFIREVTGQLKTSKRRSRDSLYASHQRKIDHVQPRLMKAMRSGSSLALSESAPKA